MDEFKDLSRSFILVGGVAARRMSRGRRV
jgi:hypothetical protein